MMDIVSLWKKSTRIPLVGKKVFSRFLGIYIPYTGSVGAEVLDLGLGKALVTLDDKRKVRNHLDSIHAVALMNIGELSTGLCVASSIPEDYRFILKHFEISYLKKARGKIYALAEWSVPAVFEQKFDCEVVSRIRSTPGTEGEVLCEVKATWRLSKTQVP